MDIVWKDVPGFEGYYSVSSDGRVLSVDRVIECAPSISAGRVGYTRRIRARIMRTTRDEAGRIRVTLSRDYIQTCHLVHTLVAAAFIGPLPPGLQVCHDDGNASNNAATNLYYGTPKQNAADKFRHGTQAVGERAHMAKLTTPQVRAIQSAVGLTQRELAERFGVCQSQIGRIRNGTQWRHTPPEEVQRDSIGALN